MVFVYVIESLTDKTWYKGIALNPFERLKEHNTSKTDLQHAEIFHNLS